MSTRHRSSAAPLALAMAALVVYASLYPFTPWQWPAGQSLLRLMVLQWPPWLTPTDMLLNLLAYVPLGMLAFVAARRSGWPFAAAFVLAVAGAALLSYLLEVAQSFLPGRHPSLKDWAMNALGALLGAALGAILHTLGWIGRWQRLRTRWFVPRSAGALALLALWPVAMLFPTPVPWGLGQIGPRLEEWLAALVAGVPWAQEIHAALAGGAAATRAMSPAAMALTSALGLLAPCLLAFAVSEPGRRRLVLAAGALVLAFVAMTLSTLLNFGPEHALAWITPVTRIAVLAAVAAALALALLPRRLVMGLALIALAALVVLVSRAPTDPYFAANLQSWEQGRFVRFHGLAQWIGWGWPFAAMAWLLARLADRD